MGYRSQVCVGMTDEASRLFRTIVAHLPEDHEVHDLIKDAETSDYGNSAHWGDKHKSPNEDCETKMYWDYVKWYDSFECVGFVEAFLTDCIPEEDYRLVRVGEETDDVEERGEYYDADIHIHRSISW